MIVEMHGEGKNIIEEREERLGMIWLPLKGNPWFFLKLHQHPHHGGTGEEGGREGGLKLKVKKSKAQSQTSTN